MRSVLVCGLGSMGKRRIRLLQSIAPDLRISGLDRRADRRTAAEKEFDIQVLEDLQTALHQLKPELVFACTPPGTHTGIVLDALEHGAHTFSEINLLPDGYEQIEKTARRKKRTAFLSSTTLYKREIQWIIQQIDTHSTVSYRYHVGQYLPDWHPWESYRDFFAARKQTSAIKEILGIELPWILKAFGPVDDFKKMETKMTDLQIDYADTLHLLLAHENGVIGSIAVDCASMRAVRKLEVFSDDLYIQWEGTPDSLAVYSKETSEMSDVTLYDAVCKNKDYEKFIIENPYEEEINDFFSTIGDVGHQPRYNYSKDRKVLGLIERILEGRCNENKQSQ